VGAFFTAPSIAWGPGAIEQLSALGARRALVVVDPALARGTAARRVVEELEKSGAQVEVEPRPAGPPSVAAVVAVRDRIVRGAADWVVALGGGTTLDVAKAARVAAEVPGFAPEAPPPFLEMPSNPRSHLAAIPTTSGSGADASWVADLVTAEGAPFEFAHRALIPDWSLVDPAFGEGRSRAAVLAEGLEVATLAAEAYLSAWSNPFSDALALDALRTVLVRLPQLVRWSDEPGGGLEVHYAATAAGIAVSNAQRGVAHALARALERPTGLRYAVLAGIALPHALDYDRPACRDRLESLATLLPPVADGSRPPLVARLRRLYETLELPTTLAAARVDRQAVEGARASIVQEALRSPSVLANPRVPSPEELNALLDEVLGSPA
jgi:alcohol dehydrogenase class IV